MTKCEIGNVRRDSPNFHRQVFGGLVDIHHTIFYGKLMKEVHMSGYNTHTGEGGV
jgi:hypothetical protein